MAVRHSPNLQAHTSPPGSKNLRMDQAMAGRELFPEFLYDFASRTDARSFNITGIRSSSSTSQIRLPYWIADYSTAGNPSISQAIHIENDPWEIDLDSTGIDFDNRIGGRLDGQALANNWYWLYAFFDDREPGNAKFKGIGAMQRPHITYTASAGSGVKGGIFLAQFGAGTGFQFAPDARVIVRTTDPSLVRDTGGGAVSKVLATYPTDGSGYNQGSVFLRVDTGIQVQLDNADITVAGRQVGYGTPANPSPPPPGGIPTGVPDGEVLQVSNPQPQLWDEDSLFPGGGTEHEFVYLGSVYVDSGLNIGGEPRYRGDIVPLIGGDLFFLETGLTATTFYNRSLARYVPIHAKDVEVVMSINNTAGTGLSFMELHTNENDLFGQIASGDTPGTILHRQVERDEIGMAPFSASVSLRVSPGAASTTSAVAVVRGYRETEW